MGVGDAHGDDRGDTCDDDRVDACDDDPGAYPEIC